MTLEGQSPLTASPLPPRPNRNSSTNITRTDVAAPRGPPGPVLTNVRSAGIGTAGASFYRNLSIKQKQIVWAWAFLALPVVFMR